ncbi:MAG: hypothetical protein V1906_00265 [Candidatus Woesearchaeota archaeon]
MEGNDKAILIVIGVLMLFGIAIYLGGHFGLYNLNRPDVYMYSNGDSEFEVRKVVDQNYVGYEIKFFYPGSGQPYYMDVRYDPASMEDIPIDRTIFNKIKDDKVMHITIDPTANLTGKTTIAALEIDKFIDNKYFLNIQVNSSVTKPYADYPIKTCGDATPDNSVIWLKTGDETKITTEGNCIIVQGKDEDDIIRAADRLVLYLVGIMP